MADLVKALSTIEGIIAILDGRSDCDKQMRVCVSALTWTASVIRAIVDKM